MLKYTIKRLFQSLITVLLVVSVVFLLLRLLPTDYFFTEEQLIKLTEEQQEDLLRANGYLDHPFVQLGRFYKELIKTEHKQHYYDRVNLVDANTFEIRYLEKGEAANIKPEDIRLERLEGVTEEYPVVQAIEAAVSTDPEKPNTVILKTDNEVQKKVKYILTSGSHTGSFTVRKEGKEVAVQDEKTNDNWDYFTNMRVWLNFGNSHRVQTGIPVVEIISSKMAVSMRIGLSALAIALVIGVPLGIMQARYKDGVLDAVGQGFTIFINAVPHLVTYFLVMIIGSRLFKLPIQFTVTDPRSSILPMVSLSMGSIASYMLWMRRYMVDELNKDYIRLAKLKGMSTTQVMFKHVMKNAFLPLAQYLPYSVLLTVGGSILVEKMFGVPGLGNLLPDAIAKYDTNLVQAIVSLYASLGIIGLFLGDVLMIILDPRIRLTGKGGTR
ncbi:MAG: ABC transporter permease [Clostridia bacterium]|nr:ABC transporter permease [Clostridia bacterium]MBQ5771851.1 ABC transporter permease [Clostridia bacterium]